MAEAGTRTSTRTLAVRNPRTGRTDFELPVATVPELCARLLRECGCLRRKSRNCGTSAN